MLDSCYDFVFILFRCLVVILFSSWLWLFRLLWLVGIFFSLDVWFGCNGSVGMLCVFRWILIVVWRFLVLVRRCLGWMIGIWMGCFSCWGIVL